MTEYRYRDAAPVPYQHQRAAFEATRDLPAWAHLWDPRTGKSRVTIDEAAYNFEAGRIDGVIIIAPNGVHQNWVINEIPAYMPERIPVCTLAYMTSRAKKASQIDALKHLWRYAGLSILAMSYDALTTEHGAFAIRDFLAAKPRVMVVLDEFHRVKTGPTRCKRTRFVSKLARRATISRGLTGTLVADTPFDVYYPVLALDETFWKRNGFADYTAFKTHFAQWEKGFSKGKTHSFERVARDRKTGAALYKNLEQLQAILKQISDRVEGGADMPESVYTQRYFEMTAEQTRVYNALRDEFMAELDGTMVTAELAITRLLRLQQVTCGYVKPDMADEVVTIPGGNPRLTALLDTLEDNPEPTIIWARFQSDVAQIVAALEKAGHAVIRYDGTLKDTERGAAVSRFQNGEAQYFVGNVSMGEGIPLFRANHTIYYSSSFKLIERVQTEDRPKKVGKGGTLGVTDLICRETIDEKIVAALRAKFDIASRVTGDTLRQWL